MKIYLEASALFKGYYPEEGSDEVDFILEKLDGKEYVGVTSIWSLCEVTRAFRKKVSEKILSDEKARNSVEFFLADLKELEIRRKLLISKIERRIVDLSRRYIWHDNLYCSDAVHVATYFDTKGEYFVAEDKHFLRFSKIKGLKLIDPTTEEGKNLLKKF